MALAGHSSLVQQPALAHLAQQAAERRASLAARVQALAHLAQQAAGRRADPQACLALEYLMRPPAPGEQRSQSSNPTRF